MPPTTRPTARRRLLAALVIFGLPLLVAGGILLALYHHHSPATTGDKTGAFNTRLPAPQLKRAEKNKLEIYLDAEKDSLRRQQQLHSDPYAKSTAVGNPPADSNERKVNEHLARLYAALHGNSTGPEQVAPYTVPASGLPDQEVTRLQQLEARIHQSDTGSNPQLQQINTLLDKVLAIQHPERLAPDRNNPAPAAHAIPYPVSAHAADSNHSPDDAATADDAAGNGFYGLSSDDEAAAPMSTAIRAVIHADQTVQTGSIVKLRLLQDIYLKGVRIPAGSFLFGPCAVGNERVTVHLSQVQHNGNVYPIDMRVLDGADGLEGLYVPGAITRDVLKESAGQSVSSLGLTNLDPSLGAQAAAAGIETARNLLSHKIRLITATLKAGQLVLLQPGQSR